MINKRIFTTLLLIALFSIISLVMSQSKVNAESCNKSENAFMSVEKGHNLYAQSDSGEEEEDDTSQPDYPQPDSGDDTSGDGDTGDYEGEE